MSGIFISYRRSDNPDGTGLIHDRLVDEFGRAKVFTLQTVPVQDDRVGRSGAAQTDGFSPVPQ